VTDHLGDDAELYPLGALDEDAARAVERHIASCRACAERVTQAGLVAASLASTLPAVPPSPALARRLSEAVRPQTPARARRPGAWSLGGFALAAAFALASIGLGSRVLSLRSLLGADDLALVTIVHSHFNHVSMTPESANPVAAKVLYARDGSWVYVIADQPHGTLHARTRTAAGTSDAGVLVESGRTATLLLHPSARIESLTLQRDGTDVAAATFAYEGRR
jgi:anti-sigma factor RsiW